MVDLAKIRKKVKKAVEEVVSGPAESPRLAGSAPEAAPAPPSVATGNGKTAVETKPEPTQTPPAPAAEPPAVESPVTLSKLERFKELAGHRREARHEANVEAGENRIELLTFVIAGEHYAVDIERIIEIVTPRNITRIPNADLSIVGIMSLRGTIVTLVDVRRKLRHPSAAQATAETRVVVVDFHGETVGFLVDRVLRVVKAGMAEVEPHPVVHASEQDDSVRGVFRVGDALTILLDLDKLLDSRALAAISA